MANWPFRLNRGRANDENGRIALNEGLASAAFADVVVDAATGGGGGGGDALPLMLLLL